MMGKYKKNKYNKVPATESLTSVAELDLDVKFVISGFCDELVRRLHKEYPATEWSGIARIEKRDGYHIMTDIIFGEQENSAATTEITGKGMQDILTEVVTNNPEAMNEYSCRIHSHHSMGCFWSGTDEEQKSGFNDGNLDKQRSVVTAYDGDEIDYKTALTLFKPVNVELEINTIVEEFDKEMFFLNNGVDIDEYLEEKNKIIEKYNGLLDELLDITVSEDDIGLVIGILNVQNSAENRAVCRELILSERKLSQKGDKDKMRKDMMDELNVLDSEHGSVFDNKLNQLKSCIVKKYKNLYGSNWNRKNISTYDYDKEYRMAHGRPTGNKVYNRGVKKNHEMLHDLDKFLD